MQFIATLVGNSFRGAEAQATLAALAVGEWLALEREPNNEYDANAIRVLTEEGVWLGYVNTEVAQDLAPYFDGTAGVAEGHTPTITCVVLDLVNPKKPTLRIEATTGYEVETTVNQP